MNIDAIENLGIARVLERGTGEVIERSAAAILVRDSVSGAYLIACDDPVEGEVLLGRCAALGCKLLMVSNEALIETAFTRCGFSDRIVCYQVAYYGPSPELDDGLTVRAAELRDLSFLLETYHNLSAEDLERLVKMQNILFGYAQGQLVGFIGEHLEGSMGLLYILPKFRRKGYAAALEKRFIARTLARGFVPFGQVDVGNLASLRLQEKLGLTRSERPIGWMWK